MRQFLPGTIIISAFVSVACGSHKKPEVVAPCEIGINQFSCSLEVQGKSTWMREYDVYKTDAKGVALGVDKHVVVLQRFKSIKGSGEWLRTGTITAMDGRPRTMVLSGRILKVDSTKVNLTIDRSSCDGVATGFALEPATDANGGRDMYYQRRGDTLSFRTSPFPKIETVNQGSSKSLSGAIANIFSTAIVASITAVVQGAGESLVDALTFGLLRDQLKDGVGSFTATNEAQLFGSQRNFAFGQLGCFRVQEKNRAEFVPSQEQNLFW